MTEGSAPVRPGDLIAGKYRVDRVLGAGGMGVVVAATHTQLDQKVALKFLLPEVVSREELVARFLREARAAVKIQSEHVSRVLDVGTLHTGAPYMVMELLEGDDLEHVLAKRGALQPPEAVGYVLEACEAIAEAHSLGVVHRDLKPANLFLARRANGPPTIKVLDFGISKAPLSDKEKALTSEAALMGSPAYMSPEQMRASRDVDARSDIWSLGVVLHELLTQSLPFPGDSVATLVTATLHEPHLPMRAFRAGLSPDLQNVIDRCLEKDATRRFASVAELARAMVPFGPPRCEQSLERIVTVLGAAGHASAAFAGGPPGPGTQAITSGGMTAASSPAAVTGGLVTGSRTLSPTSTATSGGSGRQLVIPGALLGMLSVGAVAYALLRGHGAAGPRPAIPPAEGVSAAPTPTGAPTVTPAATATAAETASATASATAPPAPSVTATLAVTATPTATGRTLAKQPARAIPSTTTAAPPACKVVTYFDADGNKRFKQVCP